MPESDFLLAAPLTSLAALRSWLEPGAHADPRVSVYLPRQRAIPELRENAILLDDVASAALVGRVPRLWVDATRTLPGSLDPVSGRCRPDGPDDLLDALSEAVLRRGGDVQPIEAERLPSPTGVVAELR